MAREIAKFSREVVSDNKQLANSANQVISTTRPLVTTFLDDNGTARLQTTFESTKTNQAKLIDREALGFQIAGGAAEVQWQQFMAF